MSAGPVEVNVEELGVRIAGYNMAMGALEADLDENGTWDAARLAPLVERLKILVQVAPPHHQNLQPLDQRGQPGGVPRPVLVQIGLQRPHRHVAARDPHPQLLDVHFHRAGRRLRPPHQSPASARS